MQQNQPYFENPLDFQYKIIDPDTKTLFTKFKELNKDAVTGNLKENEIKRFMIADSIVAECDNLGDTLTDFQEKMMREMMVLVNITKSRGGFLLKRMTEQRFIQSVSQSNGKNNNKIGD